MSGFRVPLFAAFILLSTCNAFAQETAPETLSVPTPEGDVSVSRYVADGADKRPAILVLSGGAGFSAPAYEAFAHALNAAGMDALLVDFLSPDDIGAIESAGTPMVKRPYYAERMDSWIASVRAVVDFVREDPQYQSLGMAGVSLGAMVASGGASNSADIGALLMIDGGLPDGYQPRIQSLPPTLLMWGSADRAFPLTTGIMSQQFAQSLGNAAVLDVYENAPYDFFLRPGDQQAEAQANAVTFFGDTLKP